VRVFALGDAHLGFAVNKPMDVFGPQWIDHPQTIARSWRETVTDEDLVLLPGDLTWARKLSEALPDLEFLDRLPGRKLMTKGNHDQWWDTTQKVARLCPPHLTPILNGSTTVGDLAVVAVRGWDFPGSPDYDPADERIYLRELGRLDLALKNLEERTARDSHILVMMHYPPLLDPTGTHNPGAAVSSEFVSRMAASGVATCVFAHVHGPSLSQVVEGRIGSIRYVCASADWINMSPRLILEI